MKLPPRIFLSHLAVFGFAWLLFSLYGSDDHKSSQSEVSKVSSVKYPASQADNESQTESGFAVGDLLVEYEKKISMLVAQNSLLSSEVDLFKQQLQEIEADRSLVLNKIKSMSEAELRDGLKGLLQNEHFERIQDIKSFANRLANVALEDETADSNQLADIMDIRISISADSVYSEHDHSNIVASKFHRLYVNILSSQPLGQSLIKLKSLSKGKLLYVKAHTFGNANGFQYIWVRPNEGWDAGVYQVSLYSVDDKLKLLATKQFNITKTIDEGPEQNNYDPASEGAVKERS